MLCAAGSQADNQEESDLNGDSGNSDNQPLEEVVATYTPSYRGDVPEQQRPQASENLGREAIVDAGLNDFQSVLDMSATVSRQNNMGGMFDSFAMRGFPGNENMPSGYLLNGFSGGRGYSGRRDVSNIESVEVMKGPGSALFGRSEPGGTVNITTLKPQYFTEGHIKAETGSYNHKRVEADITGALADNVAGRINGAWQDSDSFRDHVYLKKQTLSPSIWVDLSDSTSLLYELEYVKQQQPLDRGIVVLDNDFDTVSEDRFLGEPADGPITTRAWGHQLSLQHAFDNGWNLNAGLNQRYSSLEGYSTEVDPASSRQPSVTDSASGTDTEVARQRRYRDYNAMDRSARIEVSGSLDTGGISHHLMVGVDGYRYFLDNTMLRYRGTDYNLDMQNPVYGSQAPAMSVNTDTSEFHSAYGLYLQDQLDVTDSLHVLLGMRYDNYYQRVDNHKTAVSDGGKGHRFSPRLGITYDIQPDWMVYYSYSTGFMPLTGLDSITGEMFDPEISFSREIGSKFVVAGWTGTLAIFDAYKSNILTANTASDAASGSTQLGQIRSTGVELDLEGYVTESLSARMSYAWLDTRTNKAYEDNDWWTTIEKGSPIINVPENTLSLSVRQELVIGGRDANIGASYLYVDDRLGDTVDQSYRLPSYWLINLNAGMDIANGFSGKLVVSNVFDKSYVSNSYNQWWTQPGEPRTVKASVTYAF
nr:TonB-dependent siderophore receptor [Oceanobacter mangrovi]